MQMFTPEEQADAEKFLAAIRNRTDPHRHTSHTPVPLHPCPTVKSVRAQLAGAKTFLSEVCCLHLVPTHHQALFNVSAKRSG